MEQMSFAKTAIAATAFACATVLSLGWSEHGGVSLSVQTAQARTAQPGTANNAVRVSRNPKYAGRVSHRNYRGYRGAYAQERNPVGAGVAAGAGLAAGAVGTAAAIATAPLGYYGGGPYAGGGYYASSPWGDYACTPNQPGCKPFAAKQWR